MSESLGIYSGFESISQPPKHDLILNAYSVSIRNILTLFTMVHVFLVLPLPSPTTALVSGQA